MHRAVLLFALAPVWAAEPTVHQITALAKEYFRDSAEVPMTVAVTTVVTDNAGKVKHRGESAVRMVFHGYNQSSGKFSLRANSGWFNIGALRDSMSGDITTFMAAAMIAPYKEQTRKVEIAGNSVLVSDAECPLIELSPRWPVPKQFCGTGKFLLTESEGGLMFDKFSFDSGGRAGPAKVTHFGEVQCRAFHADVEFQKAFLPGDPRPYLWPKQTTITVTTNHGKLTVTNRYSARQPK